MVFYRNEMTPEQRPPPVAGEDKVTGVRLGELRAWLDSEARARGCSISDLIRQAVQEHRAKQEDATQ
jgi:hypothetical protein